MRTFFFHSPILVVFLSLSPALAQMPHVSELTETIQLLEANLAQLKKQLLREKKQKNPAAPAPTDQDGQEDMQRDDEGEDTFYSNDSQRHEEGTGPRGPSKEPMIGEVPSGWSVGHLPESGIPKHPTGRVKKTKEIGKKEGLSSKARALIKNKDFKAARIELIKLLKDNKNKDKASVFYWLGLIDLYQNKKPDQAASWLAKAYNCCEKSSNKKDLVLRIWVLLRLTDTLLWKKNTAQAHIVFEQCEKCCKALKTDLPKKLSRSIKHMKATLLNQSKHKAHTPETSDDNRPGESPEDTAYTPENQERTGH